MEQLQREHQAKLDLMAKEYNEKLEALTREKD
jgi:hypothetical protein